MPTPRPIIAASCVLKSGIVNTWLPRVTSAMPVNSPNRAVPMGRPMASTEPKAMSRMMTAARMPSSSDAGSSNVLNMSPPYWMFRPCTSTLSPRSRIWVASDWYSAWLRSDTSICANAIVPSWLICRPFVVGSNGLLTATPFSWSTCWNSPSMACCTSGVFTPLASWNTICPVAPLRSGLAFCSISKTVRDSVAGSLKSVRKLEPITPLARTLSPIRTATQTPRTSQRRRKQLRASRCNMGEPRSCLTYSVMTYDLGRANRSPAWPLFDGRWDPDAEEEERDPGGPRPHVRRGGGPDDVRLHATPPRRPSSAEFSGDVRHISSGRSKADGRLLAGRSVHRSAFGSRAVLSYPLTARDGVRTVAAVPDDLRALGWDATLDAAWSALARPPAWAPGRVRRIDRGWSSLLSASVPGEQPPPPDRVRNLGADVAVGDWVVVSEDGERVDHLLPRRSAFIRRASFEGAHAEAQPLAANIDVV